MAEHHHRPDPIEENVDSHPVQLAIGIAIGAIALVIGIVLMAQLAMNSYGDRSMKNEPAMSDAAIAQRIAPVAKLVVDPNAPPPTPPAQPATPVAQVAAAAPAGGAAGADAGKATFEKVCSACHGTGVLGAPKFGDKAAWAPRIATGKDKLYSAALHGMNAMPPKGGNPSLPDADVKAAVDYMVSAAK
ncbi:MAG TPA: c-type cytochrome [Usitatibacter sp.]|jgi:cytochrome c5|nr:c-type cytochrome [Usitatibacter sp.]